MLDDDVFNFNKVKVQVLLFKSWWKLMFIFVYFFGVDFLLLIYVYYIFNVVFYLYVCDCLFFICRFSDYRKQ